MKRLDYKMTIDCTSTGASDTIDTLASEKSNGNITGYTIEYRDSEGELRLHIWHNIPDEDDPETHYNEVNAVFSNLPVSVPVEAESAPIKYTD